MRRLLHRAAAVFVALALTLAAAVPGALPTCAMPGGDEPTCPCCDVLPAVSGCAQSCLPAVPAREIASATPAELPLWLPAVAARLDGDAPAPPKPPPR